MTILDEHDQAFTDLPFVTPSGSLDELWAVKTTGNHGSDCALGRYYADQLITYLYETNDMAFFTRLLGSMPPVAQQSGIEVGFLTKIGVALAS